MALRGLTATRATVGLLELYIIGRIGRPEFAAIAGEFAKQDAHNLAAQTLRARVGAYDVRS